MGNKGIKIMKKLLSILLICPAVAFSAEKMVINENTLKELITNNVPSIEKINAMVVQSSVERTTYNQKYATVVGAGAGYSGVSGSMYGDYNGSFQSPAKQVNVGVSQELPVGIGFNVGFVDGFAKNTTIFPSFPSIKYSQYNSELQAKLSIDLWKNLLGYSERAQRLGLKINEQEKAEQAKIEVIKFYNEIRKLYWSLNVNSALAEVYETLVNQAVIQEENVYKMYRASIADRGDLARVRALVNTRKADLLSVEYNIKRAKQELSNLIPELNGKELEFEFKSFDSSKGKILSCYNKIKSNQAAPFDLSSYTKLIQYKDEKINANLKALNRYSGPDVKLEAAAGSLGFGNDNGGSFSDMAEFKRRDYSVGLNISMPFGGQYSDTKKNQMKLLKMQYNAEKKEIISNMTSFHEYFTKSLDNLLSVREEQRKYRNNLQIRVKSMKRKYSQGRVALSDLIQDEDSLFASELSLIQTNYNIVSLMIDYLSIFNELDCDFNIKI